MYFQFNTDRLIAPAEAVDVAVLAIDTINSPGLHR